MHKLFLNQDSLSIAYNIGFNITKHVNKFDILSNNVKLTEDNQNEFRNLPLPVSSQNSDKLMEEEEESIPIPGEPDADPTPQTNQSNQPRLNNTSSSFIHKHPLNPKPSVINHHIRDEEFVSKEKVRAVVYTLLGITLIVSINICALDSAHPKYLMQLNNDTDSQKLIGNLKNDSLENNKSCQQHI